MNYVSPIFDGQDVLTGLSVMRIMVPLARIARASTSEEARALSNQYDYDFIPMPETGQPTQVYSRLSDEVFNIGIEYRISDSTPITKLALLLQSQNVLFVLNARDIVGLVHLSDLNNPTCKIPYFALFDELERALFDEARLRYTDDSLDRVFGRAEARKLRAKIEDKDVVPHPLSILLFSQLLTYCCKEGIADYSAREQKLLIDTRNSVAHGVLNLLPRARPDYLSRLLEAEALCRDISRLQQPQEGDMPQETNRTSL